MDIKLHYTETGSGEPLILLHGNGEDGTYFKHQTAFFSKGCRVIAIDTRGHGRSERGDRPFTIRQFAEDLCCFMDEHGISRANILGFSDGGNIALVFTLRYPNRVNRLILNGANLNSKGLKRLVQLPIEIGYRMALLFADKSPGAKKNAEMLGLMVNEPNIRVSELAAIKNRTLVIAGTKDMIKRTHTEQIYKSLPNAELVLIPGNHFIAAKKPEAFNRAVQQFLAAD